LLEASDETTEGLVVVLRQVVAAILVAEFTDEEVVHGLAPPLLEPLVAQAQEVEVEASRSV